MEYADLGKFGLRISRLAFGTEQLGGIDWGVYDRSSTKRAVAHALDCGITFFDTADVYALGGAEQALAEALGAARHRVVIGTKVGVNWHEDAASGRARTFFDLSPSRVKQALEDSLRRLKLDCLSLYYLHWPDPNTPLEATMEVLSRAREMGKIGSIGVSNFSAEQIRAAHRLLPLTAIQLQYNLIDRKAEQEILPCARELGIGVVTYGSLAQGLLTGKYGRESTFDRSDRRCRLIHFQPETIEANLRIVERVSLMAMRAKRRTPAQVALRWLLEQEGVTSVITGMKRPEQVDDNVQSQNWSLSQEDLQFLCADSKLPTSEAERFSHNRSQR
jgi:aryl-alcohol dehydrogenase-like predicted oxidoreductase